MKLNKRKIFVIAVALCLVAILSFSTLAWFTAEDEITNKFNFADSDDDDNVDFSVDVIETGDPEDDGLVFEDVLPGDVWSKDPTIKNTSSSDRYSQYIRVTLTLKDPEGAWKAAFDEGRIGRRENSQISEYPVLLNQMFKTVALVDSYPSNNGGWWLDENGYTDGEGFYWVFYYCGTLAKDQSVTLFTEVAIPTSLTVEDANAMKSAFDVVVFAEAIQAEHTGDNAKAAFALVD